MARETAILAVTAFGAYRSDPNAVLTTKNTRSTKDTK